MKIEELLPFLREIDHLKQVNRQTLIHSGGRRENSAEHSWHLAIAVLLCASQSKEKLDVAKAVKMALLHDIVEIDAGDTIVYAENKDKQTSELAALNRIMALLPQNLEQDFKETWLEFEKGESTEAKFVSALDRFLPIYSNCLNQGHSWVQHDISFARIVQRCKPPIATGLPELWPLTMKLLEQAKASGHLTK